MMVKNVGEDALCGRGVLHIQQGARNKKLSDQDIR